MSIGTALTRIVRPHKTGLLFSHHLVPRVTRECSRGLAAASSSASTPSASGAQPIGKRRFRLPVEQDAEKLVTHCCGANYFQEGPEIKLKADEEYPDWIWSLRLNYPPPMHELDPNTKEYWERLAIVGRQREWRERRFARRRFKVVSDRIEKLEELRYRRRFRALAHKEFDAGYDVVKHSEREDYWDLAAKERFREPDETQKFYPGIDSVDIPHQVATTRLWIRKTKKCGHFGW
ncbi:unnamed protein product [Oppiella nova]|uniref:Large ribosomal subunit protein mL54 n=1 Tax=Oppiella nova TaxID=334625 RepID=A0A7R9M664_9ACAR|nr:unnamed protein product [Oppiella nova]CAG2171228.1 unnamed protein product [Oppiella nova]